MMVKSNSFPEIKISCISIIDFFDKKLNYEKGMNKKSVRRFLFRT